MPKIELVESKKRQHTNVQTIFFPRTKSHNMPVWAREKYFSEISGQEAGYWKLQQESELKPIWEKTGGNSKGKTTFISSFQANPKLQSLIISKRIFGANKILKRFKIIGFRLVKACFAL